MTLLAAERAGPSQMVVDLRHTDVPVMVCDADGRVLGASAAAANVLRSIGIRVEDPGSVPESLRAFLGSAEPGQCQEWSQEPVGGKLALGFTRYRNGDGRFLVFMRELSGLRRSLVRRLRDQHNEIVARMSSEIAHEFRNVLASIVYNVDCLLEGEAQAPLSALQADCLDAVATSAKRLGSGIQLLLEYGRGEAFSTRPLTAAQLFDRVSSFIRASLRQRGHELQTRAAPDLPPMHGHPLAIEQIAVSMVACASLFSAAGPMRLTLSAEPGLLQGRPAIALRLRDDGEGLPKSVRSRLFDPLLEGPSGETGVSLALAREAAASIDGELFVEPAERGNSFVAWILQADHAPAPSPAAATALERRK